MDGSYQKNDDNRILLRPPSSIGTQTAFNDDNRGVDNPIGVEEETSLENGACAYSKEKEATNGYTNHQWDANGYLPDTVFSTAGKADVEYEDDDNPECGWYRWRPRCAQFCNNPNGYIFFLCVFVIAQGMTVNGLVYVVITTLEKRFGFPSSKSGSISSSYDFSVMVVIVFVTYLGEKAHKPVWLGIGAFIFGVGSLIFTLPHFLTNEYKYQNADFELCNSTRTNGSSCAIDNSVAEEENLSSYYAVFIFAQVFHGLGASPLYTLGVTYIDENVSAADSGIYIGLFKGMAIFGPAIGYIVGGLLLGIYTDIQLKDEITDITPSSPTWVGAWWLGFIISALIAFTIVFPFIGFARSLPGGKKIYAQRVSETQAGMHFEARSGWQSFLDFPKALWVLLKNPAFMFNSLSTSCEMFILVAVGVFGPKYIESQFNMTAGNAAILAGIIVTPSSFIGALFGGWLVKRLDLKYRGMMKFVLIVLVLGFVLQFVFLISCDNVDFAGVTVPYGNSSQVYTGEPNTTATCNADCMCAEDYQPVCGDDNVLYYSPCHAGCTVKGEATAGQVAYSSCECIPAGNETHPQPGTGKGGRCLQSCSSQLTFIIITFMLITVAAMIAVPALMATLRCVADSQRTFALGVQSLIYRLLGSIPGPIIFGALIDQTCLIWEQDCDNSQTCWMYNNADFSRYTLIMLQTAKLLSIIFIILALVTYKPAKEENTEETPTTISESITEIPRIEDPEEKPQVDVL